MLKEIKCKTCGKVIAHQDSETLQFVDQTPDFNSCDICGEEICFACSVTNGDFNGCQDCLKGIKLAESYVEKAKAVGIDLHIVEQIDPLREDPLWYGGLMAEFEYRGFTVEMSAIGDVFATLFDKDGEELCSVRDKNNSGKFAEEMRFYFNTDAELKRLENLEPGDGGEGLDIANNNWYEIRIFNEDHSCYLSDDLEPVWTFDDLFDVPWIKQYIDGSLEPADEIQKAIDLAGGTICTEDKDEYEAFVVSAVDQNGEIVEDDNVIRECLFGETRFVLVNRLQRLLRLLRENGLDQDDAWAAAEVTWNLFQPQDFKEVRNSLVFVFGGDIDKWVLPVEKK